MAWIVPVISVLASAASIGYSAYSQSRQEHKAASMERKRLAQWQRTAFPSAESVQEAQAQNRGELAKARLGAYQSMGQQLGQRGAGMGSGLMERGARNIEKNYLETLGKTSSDIIRWSKTPQWPANAYGGIAQPYGLPQQGQDLLSTAAGWYAMKSMYPQATNYTPSSYYNPNDYFMNYGYNFGPSYMG